jgi:hypothetical protein
MGLRWDERAAIGAINGEIKLPCDFLCSQENLLRGFQAISV